MPYESRRSLRLPGYDYTRPGAYFVTLVTFRRGHLFGEVVDGEMRLNSWGRVVREQWVRLAQRFRNLSLSEYVVMPNHLHGILVLSESDRPRETSGIGLQNSPREVVPGSVGAIVRAFKSAVTFRVNAMINERTSIWQRNYYEHIIRDEEEFQTFVEYIHANPIRWHDDRLFEN